MKTGAQKGKEAEDFSTFLYFYTPCLSENDIRLCLSLFVYYKKSFKSLLADIDRRPSIYEQPQTLRNIVRSFHHGEKDAAQESAAEKTRREVWNLRKEEKALSGVPGIFKKTIQEIRAKFQGRFL